jgi:hypothetical protein
LIEEIENNYLKGNDDYPKTLTEAYNLLVNYKNYGNQTNKKRTGGLDQVAFVTTRKRVRTDEDGNVIEGRDKSRIKCFECNQMGHYRNECPKHRENPQTVQATMLMTFATTMCNSNSVHKIDPMWILCDSESTIDVFRNKDIITNHQRNRRKRYSGR